MKKLGKILILGLTLAGLLIADVTTSNPSNYALSGVHNSVSITGTGTVTLGSGGVEIGTLYINGTGSGITITGGQLIRVKNAIYLKNVRFNNISGISALGSPEGGADNTAVFLERVRIRATGTPLSAYNKKVTARFCTFETTSSDPNYNPVKLMFNASAAQDVRTQILEFCYFKKGPSSPKDQYHINEVYNGVLAANWNYSLEGSYFYESSRSFKTDGKINTTSFFRAILNSGTDPVDGVLKAYLSSSTPPMYDKIIPPNIEIRLYGTLPAGKKLWLGYNDYTKTFEGGSTLICDSGGIKIGVAGNNGTGGEFQSRGAVQNKIRGSLTLYGRGHIITNTEFDDASGALTNYASATSITGNIFGANITTRALYIREPSAGGGNYSDNVFRNSSEGINVASDSNAAPVIQRNTFENFTSTAIRVSEGKPTITNNSLKYSVNGIYISGGAPSFTSNTVVGNNTTGSDPLVTYSAVRVTGGSPTVKQNTFSGYANNEAVRLTDGVFAASGSFENNNFTDANPQVYAPSSSTTYMLERNYWGAATPATANFTGSGAIDYEPWLNAASGTATSRKAEIPYLDNAGQENIELTNPPTKVAFFLNDIGYHNGTPLQYQFRMADSQAGLSAATIVTSGNYKTNASSSIKHSLDSSLVRGKTYYWQVRAQNALDGQGWSDWTSPVWFKISLPELDLTLSAWNALTGGAEITQQSAGGKIYYRHVFKNLNSSTMSPITLTLTAILPDDVYWSGELRMEGLTAANGSVTIKAYDNSAGSGTPQTYTATLTGDTNINYNTAPLSISQADIYRYRRFDITITTLASKGGGTFAYGSLVK
ncbi:hypothetical protein NO2_0074 [Candidatus Termititenax persephonae]|uniref:Right handed beta helix domain-containing protein n=1 Tax=Candidatus Termititenax persephonae TaxID=2218525 RepID=A0A388TEI1_9BACT|nr:hypothetical protein NO2_0074 [Candidatus Termititenax persephonae]